MSESVTGIVNLIKPSGMSSFFAVSVLRRVLDCKKAGHTGTLDPLAAGLLTICFGRATKVIPYLPEEKKEYLAEIKLGESTATLDREGEVTGKDESWKTLSRKKIAAVLDDFRGVSAQIPPMYSAVQQDGERLYRKARRGEQVEREPRSVEIFSLKPVEIRKPYLRLLISCSRGTYIRSLARDIGQKLGCGAHLSFLVRNSSGPFQLEKAFSFEEIEKMVKSGDRNFLLSPDQPLAYPQLTVRSKAHKKAVNGASLHSSDFEDFDDQLTTGYRVLVYTGEQEFVSISEIMHSEEGEIICKPLRVFYEL